MLRKVTVAAACGLAILGLSACSSSTPTATKTVYVDSGAGSTTSDDTMSYGTSTSDANMLSAIRSMSPDFSSVPDADLLETVDLICAAFAAGNSGSDVVAVAAGNVGADNARTLIAAAVVSVCPQYEAQALQ